MIYTLQEMVQTILSAMDSDEVNSINDTVEAYQVALLIKGVYYDIAVDLGLPEHETLFELDASGSSSQPCLMTVPSNVTNINWVKYDNKADADTYKDYQDVDFMAFDTFIERQFALRENTSDVGQQNFTNNGETFEMMYWTDRMPKYYTSTDDYTLLFDAYDVAIDSTLAKAKTMCHGVVYPVFELVDEFTPDLDPTGFSYLINRAKVRAFAELKQSQHAEAAGEARRQKIINQKRQRTVEGVPALFKTVRFGRKGSTGFLDSISKNLRNGS